MKPIVVFSGCRLDIMTRFVLGDRPYVVFEPEEHLKTIWKNPFKSVLRFFLKDLGVVFKYPKNRHFPRFVYKHLRARILLDRIEKLNPSCIITWIDNSDFFSAIARINRNCPTMAIQNGSRGVWCLTAARPTPLEKFCMDEYYCFGRQTEDLFRKHGSEIKRYRNCGSLIGGEYFGQNGKRAEKFDICFISQWSESVADVKNQPREWANLERAIVVIAQNLARLQREKNLRVCVALRKEDGQKELAFYKGHFGDLATLSFNNRRSLASYDRVMESNLAVALNSTLALEAFGAGFKTLFVNPLKEDWLRPTDREGVWRLEGGSYGEFRERVCVLLEMGLEDYRAAAADTMNYVMGYDFKRTPMSQLRERINSLYA